MLEVLSRSKGGCVIASLNPEGDNWWLEGEKDMWGDERGGEESRRQATLTTETREEKAAWKGEMDKKRKV